MKAVDERDWEDVQELLSQADVAISASTARRYLKEEGWISRRKVRVPLIQPRHAQARLEWARAHRHRSLRFWRRVWFSDESKFCRIAQDKRRFYWCREEEKEKARLDPRNTRKYTQGGGGSVMVWGVITPRGVGRLVRIEGIMDSKKYVKILSKGLLGTLADYNIQPSEITFQQDGDRKHTSRYTMH